MAAFILGGFNGQHKISTVAELKNNKWSKIGDLNESKRLMSTVFNNGEYMIIGGSGLTKGITPLPRLIVTQGFLQFSPNIILQVDN